MKNATLNYIINNGNGEQTLRLESGSLFYMDRNTCSFKNEEDFIDHYYNRDKIYKFIKENGNIRGKLSMTYAKSVVNREEVPIMFNSKREFIFDNNELEGKITELEKGKKLLFNSKNQLFTKLVLSTNILDDFMKKLIDIDDKERSYLEKNGYKTILYNDRYYIRFRTLFQYRVNSKKLGCIRLLYEDMLEAIKGEIMSYDDTDYYFYNRQLRIIIDKYNRHVNELSVKNLKIKSIKKNKKYILTRNNLYIM